MNEPSKKIYQEFTIPIEYANLRLDQALTKLLPDYSRQQIQMWLKSGALLINGKTTKAKQKVKGGEHIILDVEILPVADWQEEAIPLNIVHEDQDILIINKPVGMVVHPGAGNPSSTLLNALLYHCPELKLLPRAGILHRLDKDTSGLLIVAKNASALRFLTQQLKKHAIVREYQAIVYGNLISGSTIDAPIGRHHLKRQKMTVHAEGKPAVTHYRILEKYRAHTRIKLRLETGRTHQIRVHMAYIHHPIVGDSTYARLSMAKGISKNLAQALKNFHRQALHAYRLELIHPSTKNVLQIECDLPSDIKALISTLKEDLQTKDFSR